VNPNPDFTLHTFVFEARWPGGYYVVPSRLHGALMGEPGVDQALLVTVIDRRGRLALWPLKFSTTGCPGWSWRESAFEVADKA
jgi:hypothetical protein